MLKAELHIHVKGDRLDNIKYTPEELIDDASNKGFDVVALTSHNIVVHTSELENYASDKGILLIPGVERTIGGNHVLIYNISEEESMGLNSLEDLKKLKQQKLDEHTPFLVIAPHPFLYGPVCLKGKILKHFDLFDAWEHSFFYTKWFNRNKKTVKLSRKHNKPLVGNSDVHKLDILGNDCTFIDAEKNMGSVFQAIKEGRVKLKTAPLSFFKFSRIFIWAGVGLIRKLLNNNR